MYLFDIYFRDMVMLERAGVGARKGVGGHGGGEFCLQMCYEDCLNFG